MMSSSSGVNLGRDTCPSCQVCGGEASGFHYGVDSCEGCKGFFRRCITQGMTNRCANDEKCEITPFSRNSCQFCRLKKCFEVGMSREGSRLGRRPKRLKGGHGQEVKPCLHKITDIHSSSGAVSQTKSFDLMSVEQNSLVHKAHSSAMEKRRSSISAENELMSQSAEYFRCLDTCGKTRCYPNRPNHSMLVSEHHSQHSSVRQKLHSSSASEDENFLHSVSSLPAKIKKIKLENSHKSYPSLLESTDYPQSADELIVCKEEPCFTVTSQDVSFGLPNHVANVETMGRRVRSISQLYGYVPETMTLSGQSGCIKREVTTEKSAVCDETEVFDRDFSSCSSLNLCELQDPLFRQNHLKKMENEYSYANNLEIPCFERGIKNEKLESINDKYSGRNTQSRGHSSVDIQSMPTAWETEVPQSPSDPFRTNDDKLALPCTSSELEDMSVFGIELSSDFLISESMKPPTQAKMPLIKHVIETVIEAHTNTCNYTSQKLAEGMWKYKEMTMKEQAANIKKDLDLSKVWSTFVDNMAPVIMRVVKFSKKIPGFPELHQDDQISLIKQGSFEVILTRYTQLFTEDGMFVPDMTFLVPRDTIPHMPMGSFFVEQYEFAEMFNKLKLTDAEIGLLTAAMIVCPGRIGLINSEVIHQLHLLLLQSLYAFMKQSRSSECDDLFSKTIHILPFIRKINASHSKQLNNIKMTSPDIMFPPLHEEVFDEAG